MGKGGENARAGPDSRQFSHIITTAMLHSCIGQANTEPINADRRCNAHTTHTMSFGPAKSHISKSQSNMYQLKKAHPYPLHADWINDHCPGKSCYTASNNCFASASGNNGNASSLAQRNSSSLCSVPCVSGHLSGGQLLPTMYVLQPWRANWIILTGEGRRRRCYLRDCCAVCP